MSKFLDSNGLTTLWAQAKAKFALISHTHTVSQISDYVVDSALSDTSTNPVQNKAVKQSLSSKQDALTAGKNITILDNVISASGGGSKLNVTFASAFIGATYTITSSDSSEIISGGTVSESSSAEISVTGEGRTYTVTSSANGSTYSAQVETGKYYGIYDVTLNASSATLTISTSSGASVSATDGTHTYNGTADTDGNAILTIYVSGTYSCTATLSGTTTSARSVDITSNGGSYSISCQFTVIYGVDIAQSTTDPVARCTYTDDAIGMSTGHSAWADKPIFDHMKTCVLKDGVVQYYLDENDITKKADGTASDITTIGNDVMLEISEPIGYKIENDADGNTLHVKITDEQGKSGYCYDAFSYNASGDCDKIYIARFHAYNSSSKLYSSSGKTPTGNLTIGNFRTYATARGTGYTQLGFFQWTLLQCLYLIKFKSTDSQTAVGMDYVTGNSAATACGMGNAYGFDSEVIKASNPSYLTDGNHSVICNGVENMWGNVYDWIDGFFSNASYHLTTAPYASAYNDTGSGYTDNGTSGFSSNTEGYPAKVQGTNGTGFIIKDTSGSSSTYYCDYGYVGASFLACAGGAWDYGSDAGAFQFVAYNSASDADAHFGARLCFLHVRP